MVIVFLSNHEFIIIEHPYFFRSFSCVFNKFLVLSTSFVKYVLLISYLVGGWDLGPIWLHDSKNNLKFSFSKAWKGIPHSYAHLQISSFTSLSHERTLQKCWSCFERFSALPVVSINEELGDSAVKESKSCNKISVFGIQETSIKSSRKIKSNRELKKIWKHPSNHGILSGEMKTYYSDKCKLLNYP